LATASGEPAATTATSKTTPWTDHLAVFLGGIVVMWAVGGGTPAHLQLGVCLLTSLGWIFARVDATAVALVGALAVSLVAVLAGEDGAHTAPLAHLGDPTTVLVVAAFVLAKAVERSGLAARVTERVIGRRDGALAYVRLGLGVFAATFLMPSTAGRAGVLVPLVQHAKARAGARGAQRSIALMAPLVVVLGAFAYPVAAAANLVAMQLLATQADTTLSFARWIALAAPLAALMAAAAMAVAWAMFRHDRRPPLTVAAAETTARPAGAPGDGAARRTALILVVVVGLWSTGSFHPFDPMLVAVFGAVLVTLPRVGVLGLAEGLKGVDWSVVLLLAAAAQLSGVAADNALVGDATRRLAEAIRALDGAAGTAILAGMTLVAMLAHLAVGSRSARALLLMPATLAVAGAAGMEPTIAVLAVTAGTGFCILTPVGSKALIVFAGGDGRDLDKRELARAGLVLLPVQLVLTLAFALWVWPVLIPEG